MGRLKIKKKDEVIPFRQTLAYRMIMLVLSVLFFLFLLYEMVIAWSINHMGAFIIAAVPGVASAFAIFYNLDHLRDAKVPARTLKRMKRR